MPRRKSILKLPLKKFCCTVCGHEFKTDKIWSGNLISDVDVSECPKCDGLAFVEGAYDPDRFK